MWRTGLDAGLQCCLRCCQRYSLSSFQLVIHRKDELNLLYLLYIFLLSLHLFIQLILLFFYLTVELSSLTQGQNYSGLLASLRFKLTSFWSLPQILPQVRLLRYHQEERHTLCPLSLTSQSWYLWFHECGRGQIQLSSMCVTLPCDATWACGCWVAGCMCHRGSMY